MQRIICSNSFSSLNPGGDWKLFNLDLDVNSELSTGGIYLSLFWWFLCFGVMEDEGGSSPNPDLNAFRRLPALGRKRKLTQTQQTFVKKLENIPSVVLPVETCQTAINIAEWGLIGQFTRLWPSPKTIAGWVQRN